MMFRQRYAGLPYRVGKQGPIPNAGAHAHQGACAPAAIVS